ncbi:MAG: hypothetical protein K6G88_06465 [Lachnospiraceae bacterium]|nr:hypothetical protein [Lachnospiraceae bacterium]
MFSLYEQANIDNVECNVEKYYVEKTLCINTSNITIDLRGISKLKKIKELELRTKKSTKLKIKNFSEINKMGVESLVFSNCKISKLNISNMKKT